MGRQAYTVAEFCEAYRITKPTLYKWWKEGTGPRYMQNGRRRYISFRAAEEWVADREAATDMG